MNKKKIIAILSTIAIIIATPLAVYAFQVDSTGAIPVDSTNMYGYLYRSSSSSYIFDAETRIAANPYGDASLYVKVTVVPFSTPTNPVVKEASTTHSTYISVTSPTASTTNASSASGSHEATIYNGPQYWGNTGSTSWVK